MKMESKKTIPLAVIMPVYNGEKYLRQAALSVLNQPCRELILIIVDDGSKDASCSIEREIEETDERVFLLNQAHMGVSAARNQGIDFALRQQAKYLAFLDCDDAWAKGFYDDELYAEINKEENDVIQFSYMNTNQRMTRGALVNPYPIKNGKINQYGKHFCAYFYRSKLINDYYLRFPVGIRFNEDKAFQYVFFYINNTFGKCATYPRISFLYRSNCHSALHKEYDPSDRYFTDIIPAWKFAYSQIQAISSKLGIDANKELSACLTMQKTYLCQYIVDACSKGIPIKTIKQTIEASEFFQLLQDSSIWLDENNKRIWRNFCKHPYRHYCFFRVLGILFSFARLFRMNPLYEVFRYPLEL